MYDCFKLLNCRTVLTKCLRVNVGTGRRGFNEEIGHVCLWMCVLTLYLISFRGENINFDGI